MKKVLENTSCSSLKTFEQFGFGVPYSTMKNYFSEKRLLPKDLFDNFCHIAKLNPQDFKTKFIEDTWGQVKGGKKIKRR